MQFPRFPVSKELRNKMRVLVLFFGKTRLAQERGSEPVSFALVVPLVMFVVLGILQLSLALWVKTTLIDAASAGAHAAALTNTEPSAAENTVRGALSSTVGSSYVKSVSVSRVPIATVSNAFAESTVEAVQVTVTAPIPMLGFFGAGELKAVGHAMAEVGP